MPSRDHFYIFKHVPEHMVRCTVGAVSFCGIISSTIDCDKGNKLCNSVYIPC